MTRPTDIPMAKGHADPNHDMVGAERQLPANATPDDRLLGAILGELLSRRDLVDLYDAYYEGRHRLTFVSQNYRQAWGRMIAAIGENWCHLVIQASVERLAVQGFVVGEGSDKRAWDIWTRCGLDIDISLAFQEAAKHGESYLLVEPDPAMLGRAQITVEHPRQMVVLREAGNRRKLTAAAKHWIDPVLGVEYVTLWRPTETLRYERWKGQKWFGPRTDMEPWERQPLGEVPVYPLVNDPAMLPSYPPTALTATPHSIAPVAHIGLGRSNLADVIATQDVVNILVSDMIVSAETQAYKQRWATGLEVPRDPATGEPIEPFKLSQQRLWVSENKDTKFGDFTSVDLSTYLAAIEDQRRSISSRSRIPVHVLMGGSGNWPSGQSLRAAETGLTTLVRQAQRNYNGPLLAATRAARLLEGGSPNWTAAVNWMQPEIRVESEYADSLIKQLAIGVPPEVLFRNIGYAQSEIDEFGALWEKARVEGLPIGALDALTTPPADTADTTQPADLVGAGATPSPAQPVAPIA